MLNQARDRELFGIFNNCAECSCGRLETRRSVDPDRNNKTRTDMGLGLSQPGERR